MPLRPGTSPLAVAGALGLVYVLWGSTYTGIAYALETMPPLLLSGTRFLAAGALLLAGLRAFRIRLPRPTRREWAAAFLTGTPLLAIGNGGVVWAQQHVASGIAALLIATVPLWIALLDRLVFGRTLDRRSIFGLGLGFAGIAILVNIGGGGGGGPARARTPGISAHGGGAPTSLRADVQRMPGNSARAYRCRYRA